MLPFGHLSTLRELGEPDHVAPGPLSTPRGRPAIVATHGFPPASRFLIDVKGVLHARADPLAPDGVGHHPALDGALVHLSSGRNLARRRLRLVEHGGYGDP